MNYPGMIDRGFTVQSNSIPVLLADKEKFSDL
jgi:hypothetical protein